MPRPLTAAQTEKRINEIVKDLEALTLRTQVLSRELRSLPGDPPESSTIPQNPFVIGDFVRITNSYKGRKNTSGNVIKVTDRQAMIRNIRNSHTQLL